MNTKKSDWSTKVLLLAVVGLLAANLVIMSGLTSPRTAMADGIPDTGAQMQTIIDQIKGTNTRLDAMQKFLESGNMKVVTKAQDKSDK